MYIPETNVLLTRFLADDGIVELTDFMPVNETPQYHCIMRRMTVINGETRVRLRCAPRFNYARSDHRVERHGEAIVFTAQNADSQPIFLQSTVSLEMDGGDASASFLLKAGRAPISFLASISMNARRPPWANLSSGSSTPPAHMAAMGSKIALLGPLARNGQSFGIGSEIAHG